MRILSKRTLLLTALCGITMLSFSACTSRSTSKGYYNGKFVDNAVAGADYECGSKKGTTDNDGVFGPCLKGTTTTISIGDVVLGRVGETSDGIVTPQDIAGASRTDVNNTKAKKIASLLLSLDPDGNPDNGIQIFPEIKEAVSTSLQAVESIDEANVSDIIQDVNTTIASNPNIKQAIISRLQTTVDPNINDLNLTKVTPEEAAAHLEEVKTKIDNGEITPPPPPPDNATD